MTSKRIEPVPEYLRDDTNAARVWLILFKAAHAIEQNALLSVSALGLCLSDFAVLEVLLHKGSLPVSVLGRKILLTSGSITSAVDRLATKGLVRRSSDPADLRSRVVHLTAKGKTLIEKAFRQHAKDMEETLAVLKVGERAELIRLLKKAGLCATARLEDHQRRPKPDARRPSHGLESHRIQKVRRSRSLAPAFRPTPRRKVSVLHGEHQPPELHP
jgi:MarR family 2-MHQ and catechol resistance regulon transcriptional repressor